MTGSLPPSCAFPSRGQFAHQFASMCVTVGTTERYIILCRQCGLQLALAESMTEPESEVEDPI